MLLDGDPRCGPRGRAADILLRLFDKEDSVRGLVGG